MESQEVLMGYPPISNGSSDVAFDVNGFERGEIADVVLEDLEGLDGCMEDISDRLVISRMVSDSVIKGMVTAVEQETEERIAAKELELTNLKQSVGTRNKEGFSYISDACLKHEKLRGDLFALRKLTREQLEKAKKEVEHGRETDSTKKTGLGGILQENKMLEGLQTTLDAFCSEVDDILMFSEISLYESQEDRDLLGKLEDTVMHSVIESLQEENNAQLDVIQTVNWLENLKGVSGLGTQLEEIQKSLVMHETRLVSFGSHDLDHLNLKAFGNHVGENGTVNESNVNVAGSYDFQQLKHLSGEKMVGYFNGIITKLKREHESVLEEKTDKYFRLKREYLNMKERGGSTTHKKDEEFDMIMKKIPEIISKLEGFFSENERFPALTKNLQSVGKLKHRVDDLLFENRQLRNTLSEKENEVKSLEAQVLGATEALLQKSLAEENLLKLVENLKSSLEDSFIEASVTEEIYKSALREQVSQTRYISEDSNMEICDIIIRESPNRFECEDSDIESLMTQGLSGLIFTEAIMEIRNYLETTALDKENELRLEIEETKKLLYEENKKLLLDIQELRTDLEQKEKLSTNLSFSLSKEREKLEVASRELSSLRDLTSQLERRVAKSDRDIELLNSRHLEALQQIELNRIECLKLKQNLDQTKDVLSEANKEKNRALTVAQEMRGKLLLSEDREEIVKKEMESAVSVLSDLFDDFECRISEASKKNSIRFKDTSSQLKALNKVANDLRRREITYKQKLDLKSVNLDKAESEVDHLGDEVESLLRLLNKIYIALDHYSPVLKHYPGIIEILALVKRELSGESAAL